LKLLNLSELKLRYGGRRGRGGHDEMTGKERREEREMGALSTVRGTSLLMEIFFPSALLFDFIYIRLF